MKAIKIENATENSTTSGMPLAPVAASTKPFSSDMKPTICVTAFRRVIIINKGQIQACDTPENLLGEIRRAGGVVLEAKVGSDNGLEQLKQIASVRDVTATSEGDWQRFALRVESGTDVREEVFRLARDRQWAVRELSQRKATLEDVFVEMTHSDDA